ncbi:MAG: hypothetical protein R3E13_00780 [Alphaproteobacteria bacterium]
MAGSLSGVAAQQIPVSQPSQQDQNNTQVRQREERDPEDGRVQPQGAAAAESQGSEASNQNDLQRQADELLAASQGDNGQQSETLRRGSLVDIVT